LYGRYQQFRLPQIPVSPELYALVAPFEGRVLAMLERIALNPIDTFPLPVDGVPKFTDSYEARADLFFRHCRFWNYVFSHLKINALVAQNFGHQGYDEVAISLAQALGIPTLIFNDTTTLPFVQFVQEHVSGLGDLELGTRLKSAIREEMTAESQDFVKRHLTAAVNRPDRFEVKPSDFRTSLFSSWLADNNVRVSGTLTPRQLVFGLNTKLKRFWRSPLAAAGRLRVKVPRYLATKRAQREENLHVSLPPDGKYLYFPLNFQPEASTSIKGRHFYRLREAVTFVASELPPDYTLVVKEHPHQLRRHYPRAQGFFSQIAAIPRVTLVHHATDNEHLILNASGVCAIAHSSISAHALFNGKPVISLGYAFFKEAPNFYSIDSTRALRAAIQAVTLPRADGAAIIDLSRFFERLEDATFEGVLGYRPLDVSETEYQRLVEVTSTNLGNVISKWLNMKFTS